MKRMLLAATFLAFLAPVAAHAQGMDLSFSSDPVGKQAGSVMVRLRAIGVMPLNSASNTSIGGKVETSYQAAPEVDLSYFFTDNIAVEAIAASTRHQVSATGTALGTVQVGSAWVLPPTVTAQWHFMPHERFSPYIGAGLTVAFFYNTQPNNPPITKFALSTTAGPAVQIGFDYNIAGHWFANFDVKQMIFKTHARMNGGAVTANTWLNPLVVGAGIGYRF